MDEAGREWITPFERVQAPLVPPLLANEELASEAARLIEAAGWMVEDDEAVLPDDEVERGLSLVRRLTEATESEEVSSDLETVVNRLEDLRGQTSRGAVHALMQRGPKRRKPFGG